jgi:hypothetical protein
VIQAIKDGVPAISIRDEMIRLEERKAELKRRLVQPEIPPLLHPTLSDVYREKVSNLRAALEGDESSIVGARDAIRGLLDAVCLEPDGNHLRIVLKGNLAGMLRLAQKTKRSSETDDLLDQILLVAGARNPLDLEFAWSAA